MSSASAAASAVATNTAPAVRQAPLLEANDLVAGYIPEVNILTGCDAQLYANEIVGVIGPNGAGKSTLLKAIFGLVSVRSGSVFLDGAEITSWPAYKLVREGLGYVPQVSNTFLSLTVQENLKMGAWINGRVTAERREAVFELFPKLKERWEQQVWQMSGGERQMVAMSRALVADPKILLLDEPSAGLSPANQEAVFDNVQRVRDAGVSIMIVEQNARACLDICNRAYVLNEGKPAFEGPSRELLDDAKVQQLFLGSLIGR